MSQVKRESNFNNKILPNFEFKGPNPFEFDKNNYYSNVQGKHLNINHLFNSEQVKIAESKKVSEIKKAGYSTYPANVFNLESESSVKKLEERLREAGNENLRRNIELLGGIEDTISSS